MRGIIIVLAVLLGIVSWNSANFAEYDDPYGLFCAIVFACDVTFVGGLIVGGLFED